MLSREEGRWLEAFESCPAAARAQNWQAKGPHTIIGQGFGYQSAGSDLMSLGLLGLCMSKKALLLTYGEALHTVVLTQHPPFLEDF